MTKTNANSVLMQTFVFQGTYDLLGIEKQWLFN